MCAGVRDNSKDCQIGLTTNGQMQAVWSDLANFCQFGNFWAFI